MCSTEPTFEVLAKDYRTNIPFNLQEEIIDEKIKLFSNDPKKVISPMTGMEIVKISKIETVYQKEKQIGIMLICISLQKFMIDKGLKESDKFFVKLSDKEGNVDDKCILTQDKIPYFFYYDGNKNFSIIE